MKSNLAIEEQHYQTTIYLNDRPYKVMDVGEGECTITIVSNIEDYIATITRFSPNQRSIIVDVSEALNSESQDAETLEKVIANDLHLLFDVFWLEEVKIHSDVSNLNMSAIYNVVRIRNYSRSLLSFSQQLEHKQLHSLK